MKKLLLTLVVILGAAASLAAQGVKNVRINEVLVINEDNYTDDYGHRSSWIEIFNTGYEVLDLGACTLAVTKSDGREIQYNIPKGDPATKMRSQTYLLFFCEGTDTKGTFYTNFTLDDAVKITLYSGSKAVINEFPIDSGNQKPDVSVGWMSPDGMAPAVMAALPKTTPNATNETLSPVSKGELFRQQDKSGVVMTIIALSVVFCALILIFLVLKGFGAVMIWWMKRKEKPALKIEKAAPKKKKASQQVEEEMAAIALAVKMYQEDLHIRESTVITINRVNRAYSPWSSKIYGIPPMPNKK